MGKWMSERKGGWEEGWIDDKIDERMSTWLSCHKDGKMDR